MAPRNVTDLAPQIDEASQPEAPPPEPLVFEFRGNAREYFRIWVVNLALSLCTLGLYSPWAKVRRLRYFYGNTYLDGSSFEFLGSPIAILKGRAIAVTAFAAYWYASHFHPIANIVLVPVLALGFPWVMVKALRFRARHSAYRNITFSYDGHYGTIAFAYLALPLLAVGTVVGAFVLFGWDLPELAASGQVTFAPEVSRKVFPLILLTMLAVMIAYPYFYYLQRRAYLAPRRFGEAAFAFDCHPRSFYHLFLLMVVYGAIAVITFFVAMWFVGLLGTVLHISLPAAVAPVAGSLAFGLVNLLLFVTFITLVRNRVISALRIGEATLSSRLNVGTVYMLYLTNIVAVVCSLGLLAPWAKVRLTYYQLARTSLLAPHGTQVFTGTPAQSASAVGEELAEVFDLDLAI